MKRYEIIATSGWCLKLNNFSDIISFFENVDIKNFIDFYIRDNEFGDSFTPIDIIHLL